METKTATKTKMKLNVVLDEKLAEEFMAIKKASCLKHNQSILALLIGERYAKLQETQYRKLFVDPEVYERIEKQAEAEGVTVDIYTTELLKKQIEREIKEGRTHEN